jgi:hypothetical protein
MEGKQHYFLAEYTNEILLCECKICKKYSGYGKCNNCWKKNIINSCSKNNINCYNCNKEILLIASDSVFECASCILNNPTEEDETLKQTGIKFSIEPRFINIPSIIQYYCEPDHDNKMFVCRCLVCSKYDGYGDCRDCKKKLYIYNCENIINCKYCKREILLLSNDNYYSYAVCFGCQYTEGIGTGLYICSHCIMNKKRNFCCNNNNCNGNTYYVYRAIRRY